MEVPHMHIHVFPAWTLDDFSFARAKQASDEELDQAAARLGAALEQALRGFLTPRVGAREARLVLNCRYGGRSSLYR
jgi:hypothetical protein